jgi:hypothetical protein
MPERDRFDEEFTEVHVEPLRAQESKAAAAGRMRDVDAHIDEVVRSATGRGEFEDLPGAGEPIEDLGTEHDPDWWIKRLVEREQIVVLPPSIQLRKDDAALDDLLDKQPTEQAVREVVEDFNKRVLAARYSLPQGPPLITMPRDVEDTVARWRERREARSTEQALRGQDARQERPRRRRWWRRRAG